LEEDDKILEGFAWRIDERPAKIEILMDPAEAERIREESRSSSEDEDKPKLMKLLDKNIDVERIKDQLKKPDENLQKQ